MGNWPESPHVVSDRIACADGEREGRGLPAVNFGLAISARLVPEFVEGQSMVNQTLKPETRATPGLPTGWPNTLLS